MADVGDRVAVRSKAGDRTGLVTAVSGSLVTVRWDTGGQTLLAAGAGVLRVVRRTRGRSSGQAAAKKSVTKKTAVKKTAATKQTTAKKTTAKKAVAKTTTAKKAGARKTVAKKAGAK